MGITHPLKGEAPWCFCVLRAGSETGKDLKAELTDLVSRELGRSFRPERVSPKPPLRSCSESRAPRSAMHFRRSPAKAC